MAKNIINTKRGFTIIEVVLVLAIAGLIFLMVFIALPNLQRSQRDTARRNDYASFAANITGYITNNNGNLPGEDTTGKKLDPKKYINNDGTDTSGKNYKIYVYECKTAGSPCAKAITELSSGYDVVNVYLVKGAKCDDGTQGAATESTGNRDYAVIGQLESGVFCQDNV